MHTMDDGCPASPGGMTTSEPVPTRIAIEPDSDLRPVFRSSEWIAQERERLLDVMRRTFGF